MDVSLTNALTSLNSDDSDEDDDDYVPSGGDESEEEDIEGDDEHEEGASQGSKAVKGKKKPKPRKDVKSRKRKGGITLSDEEETAASEKPETTCSPDGREEVKKDCDLDLKKKADSLWEDFLSDVTPPAKKMPKQSLPVSTPVSKKDLPKPVSKPEKITITKVFEFAGESVEVKEEVDSNSKEAKLFSEEQQNSALKQSSPSSSSESKQPVGVRKSNGLNAVLGKVLGKKNKLSTLEKSKLDWNSFKKEEGVEEVLDQYKRSKDGYLEKQAFLERTDLRQFEREKELRAANRSHRL